MQYSSPSSSCAALAACGSRTSLALEQCARGPALSRLSRLAAPGFQPRSPAIYAGEDRAHARRSLERTWGQLLKDPARPDARGPPVSAGERRPKQSVGAQGCCASFPSCLHVTRMTLLSLSAFLNSGLATTS